MQSCRSVCAKKEKDYRLSNATCFLVLKNTLYPGTNPVLGKRFSKGACFHSVYYNENYIKAKQKH